MMSELSPAHLSPEAWSSLQRVGKVESEPFVEVNLQGEGF